LKSTTINEIDLSIYRRHL